MEKEISRQAKWQKKKKLEKLCVQCGKETYMGTVHCQTCLDKKREYTRKILGFTPWKQGGVGRPPVEVSRKDEVHE